MDLWKLAFDNDEKDPVPFFCSAELLSMTHTEKTPARDGVAPRPLFKGEIDVIAARREQQEYEEASRDRSTLVL